MLLLLLLLLLLYCVYGSVYRMLVTNLCCEAGHAIFATESEQTNADEIGEDKEKGDKQGNKVDDYGAEVHIVLVVED